RANRCNPPTILDGGNAPISNSHGGLFGTWRAMARLVGAMALKDFQCPDRPHDLQSGQRPLRCEAMAQLHIQLLSPALRTRVTGQLPRQFFLALRRLKDRLGPLPFA